MICCLYPWIYWKSCHNLPWSHLQIYLNLWCSHSLEIESCHDCTRWTISYLCMQMLPLWSRRSWFLQKRSLYLQPSFQLRNSFHSHRYPGSGEMCSPYPLERFLWPSLSFWDQCASQCLLLDCLTFSVLRLREASNYWMLDRSDLLNYSFCWCCLVCWVCWRFLVVWIPCSCLTISYKLLIRSVMSNYEL